VRIHDVDLEESIGRVAARRLLQSPQSLDAILSAITRRQSWANVSK
jgi:hypothetical protein